MQEDLAYWISFNKISGLGPIKLYSIYDYFGDLKLAWSSNISEFNYIKNLSETNLEEIKNARKTIEPEKDLEFVLKKKVNILTLKDENYPKQLKHTHDPPFVLFYRGNINNVSFDKCIGIVGTRKPSYSGKKISYSISNELANFNITIISGLALGVDTEVHKGALKADYGNTIAILGCGPDIAYPQANKKLYEEIIEQGLIISEYLPETPPDSWRFPARNRLISGISNGVLIVEAGEKSGALITMDFALEQGREVMAIPGDILNPMSIGPNNLIKQGAVLVTSAKDILENLKWNIKKENAIINLEETPHIENLNLTEVEKEICFTLGSTPIHLDTIISKINLPLADITSNLIMLELKQIVKQLPGKLFIKI